MPATSIGLIAGLPVIASGASIAIASDLTLVDTLGGIGFNAIGEFGIGMGPPLSHTIKRAPTIELVARVPSVVAGASIVVPARNISVLIPIPQIGARRRALKALVIAS